MTDAWNKLNHRQQTYLRLIYEEDQAQERSERQRAALDRSSRPAEVWRWITYANTMYGRTPLKQKIKDANMVDPGTGSTFEALEKRGYILTRSEGATPHPRSELIVHIRLTTKGRRLVRQALNLPSSSKMVVGTLREWHWRALVRAYEAGEQGVPAEGIGYGRIGWPTWLRLRDYKIQGTEYPLIREHNGVTITDFGVGYYERSFPRYSDLYPDVSAPTPRAHHDPLEPLIEIVQDYRPCRACIGYYLVAVTRVYQQNQKWVWSVQESEQRIAGQVIRKYRETEQCICQEEEIQEIWVPFLRLLDQLTEQGWQVAFPYHHWFHYVDVLVGDVALGREQRWYDPALVSQKLQPLLSDTDWPDERNIVKGEVCYFWNPRVGKGKVYPREPNGDLSLRPVALTRKIDTRLELG